jgi:Carboxypeptidase regulatory-like domain
MRLLLLLTTLSLVACGGDKKKPSPTGAPAAPSIEAPVALPPPVGLGTLRGVVTLSGAAPEMKVPTARKTADFCKTKEIPHNAVRVVDGKLADVFVRLAPGSAPGAGVPANAAQIDQTDCTFAPRVQGVVTGQSYEIRNQDGVLHSVIAWEGVSQLFQQTQPKGSPAITKEAPNSPSVVRMGSGIFPWMRGFLFVTDHPFFAVTSESGAFELNGVPAGTYTVEAWHTQYGKVEASVTVSPGVDATVNFQFDASMSAPAWNSGELQGLF